MQTNLRFRDLNVGDQFDFIDDQNPQYNSFYDRCEKVSARRYLVLTGRLKGQTLEVGSFKAQVFHIIVNQEDK